MVALDDNVARQPPQPSRELRPQGQQHPRHYQHQPEDQQQLAQLAERPAQSRAKGLERDSGILVRRQSGEQTTPTAHGSLCS